MACETRDITLSVNTQQKFVWGRFFPRMCTAALFEGLIPWLILLWTVLTFIHLQNLTFIVNQSAHSREIIFLWNHVSIVCTCPRKTPASHCGSWNKVPTSDTDFCRKLKQIAFIYRYIVVMWDLTNYLDKCSSLLISCLCSVYAPGNLALSFCFPLCCVQKLKKVFSFFSLLHN